MSAVRVLALFALGIAGLAAVNYVSAAQQASAPYSVTFSGGTGEPVLVEWGNGAASVRIVPDAPAILGKGTVHARAATQERARELAKDAAVRIERNPGGGVVVRLVAPELRSGESVWADVEIVLPAAAPIQVETSNGAIAIDGNTQSTRTESDNGAINIRGQRGDVSAETDNGAITIDSTGGSVVAETSNGAITLKAAPARDQTIKCESVNGAIQLTLPRTAGVDLDIQTTNGGVDAGPANIGIRDRGGKAAINGGGAKIRLATANGGIEIDWE